MKKYRLLSYALVFTLILSSFSITSAAKKPKLSKKNISLTVGQTAKVKVKNAAKNAKVKWTSSKKSVVKITKKTTKGKNISASIKGIATGKAVIKVTYKTGSKKTKLACAVTVNSVTENTHTSAPIVTPSIQPTPVQTAEPTIAPTAEPTAVPPTRTPLVIDDTSTPSDFNVKQSGVSYGNLSRVTYYSTTVGKERAFNVITPPDYDPAEKYPVLYLCHGGNGDEGDWISGKPDVILGNLIAKDEAKPMIMVLVNCRARMNDGANPSDSLSQAHMDAWTNFLFELQADIMPYMEENYPILTGRENTGICGLSMGGRESLYIGFKIPEKIAYIGAFSPAFGIFEYENWGLHEDGYFTEDEFTLPEEYMDTTTCLIVNGQNDSMVRDEPERYHNALASNGVNHYYYTIPGDHNMDVWANGLYHFLKVAFK